ncbi:MULTISPECIES: FkbM family methyltransferase [Sphingobacterium]|uniref:FkbM family methyltransferase n=1 Tax=Sphingobacterium tenebrionis TaxID=3111775 RepID=A0ABU8I5Q3_9SPHI|nr:FkbM family methyltransferase [Sphingobacterium sp. 1.A.4]
MSTLKQTILKYFPIHKFFHARSFSQEGEDMVIRGFYEAKKGYKGVYVDVGAHHPYRFSNTNYFYKKGWRGINIEPSPDAMRWFKWFRPKDVNLNIGISESPQELTYYCFNEPALNGFSQEVSESRDGLHAKYHLLKTIPVPTLPLSDVLDKYLAPGKQIDFLSVDAEGFDLIVLKSNNWEKYKPVFVLVEEELSIPELNKSEVYQLMLSKGYSLVAKTKRTLFFKRSDLTNF